MPTDRELKLWLIKKLVRNEVWGKYHLSVDDIAKGQERSLKGRIVKIVKDLRRKGILVRFSHKGEKHYHLNPYKKEEIYKIIEKS